jgi:Tol biopolymer transport system component/DNA-binding SARP family transcriptional activator
MNELYLFGEVDLRGADGNRVNSIVSQPKTLALLAYLCLAARGRSLTRDRLISVFWPDLPESNARNALNQALHRLRQALGPDSVCSLGTNVVEVDGSVLSCDAAGFLEALDAGELTVALDLYRGELLAGVNLTGTPDFERWLDDERAWLKGKAFGAALELGRAAEDSGELEAALLGYRRAMAISPERGAAVRGLMTVLARSGNPAAAVRVYDRFASRLAEDFGLQPSEETRAVLESIRQEPVSGEPVPKGEAATRRRPAEGSRARAESGQRRHTSASGRTATTRRTWHAALPVLLGAAAVLIAGLFVSSAWPGRGSLDIATSNFVQVTNRAGLEFQPALSPDGSEVVYVEGPIEAPGIVVRSAVKLGTGESRLAETMEGYNLYPSWTADGSSVRFWNCWFRWWSQPGCEWKQVGGRGGPVRGLGVPVHDRLSWSPDGRRVVFSSRDSIYVASQGEGEATLLAVQNSKMPIPHSFSWSPDGALIAYACGNHGWRTGSNVADASIWVMGTDGGTPVAVTEHENLNVSPQWLPDSRHLLFVSDRDGARGVYVVEVDRHGAIGSPKPVPGAVEPHSISVSADGKRLAYSRYTVRQNLWRIPVEGPGPVSIRQDLAAAVPITTGNHVIEGFDLSPDGEWIAFDNFRRGEFDIYRQRLDGGEPELVADIEGHAYSPLWSPDGTELLFHGGLTSDVFVVSADGGMPENLTDSPGQDFWPRWAPDGLSIVHQSWENEPGSPRGYRLWRVVRERVGAPWSPPMKISEHRCVHHAWMPDGQHLLCQSAEDWTVLSVEGESRGAVAVPAGMESVSWPRFSPDGSRLLFRGTHEDGREGLWWMPAQGGEPTLAVAFDHPSIEVNSAQYHGDSVILVVVDTESDIWAMDLDW